MSSGCSLSLLLCWIHKDVLSWEGYNAVAESFIGAKKPLLPRQCVRKRNVQGPKCPVQRFGMVSIRGVSELILQPVSWTTIRCGKTGVMFKGNLGTDCSCFLPKQLERLNHVCRHC